MTKNDFKQIVKECLLEILSEGVGASTHQILESKKASRQVERPADKKTQEPNRVRQSIANKIQYGLSTQKTSPAVSSSQQSSVGKLIRSVTNDDIMASLFADTAQTTLREQIENDRRLLRGNSSDESRSPQDDAPVGGEGFSEEMARHWSSLAFSDKKVEK